MIIINNKLLINMKKLFTLCAMVLLCATILAQAPQKMSYQAVVRGNDNALVANQNVSVRISILQGSASGAAVYSETHNATTNANGLLTVEVGGGNSSQNFSQIPWAQGPFYLKSEIDRQKARLENHAFVRHPYGKRR